MILRYESALQRPRYGYLRCKARALQVHWNAMQGQELTRALQGQWTAMQGQEKALFLTCLAAPADVALVRS